MTTATNAAIEVVNLMDDRRLIYGLSHEHQLTFRSLLFCLAYNGYGQLRVIAGKRTLEIQQVLYGKGRSAEECWEAEVPKKYARPGENVVTWCLPRLSKHVSGEAIDLDMSAYNDVGWGQISIIASTCGLIWGGNWRVKDYGHFEI